MTRPGSERRSPGPLANSLPTRAILEKISTNNWQQESLAIQRVRIVFSLDSFSSCCVDVLGRGAFRPAVFAATRLVWVCFVACVNPLSFSGAVSQVLTFSGGVSFIAWCLSRLFTGEYRHFLPTERVVATALCPETSSKRFRTR